MMKAKVGFALEAYHDWGMFNLHLSTEANGFGLVKGCYSYKKKIYLQSYSMFLLLPSYIIIAHACGYYLMV